jgi:uncharacterized membrane protein YkoI
MKYFIIAFAFGCGARQDKPTAPPPNLPVSMDQARSSALAAVPGQVEKQELDSEDGRWIYEFEIQPATAGAPKQEVDVDATTGAVQVEADD